MNETAVTSFVVRFVSEPSPPAESATLPWHGVIRHVQSEEEQRFIDISEALSFMGRFVRLPQANEDRSAGAVNQ